MLHYYNLQRTVEHASGKVLQLSTILTDLPDRQGFYADEYLKSLGYQVEVVETVAKIEKSRFKDVGCVLDFDALLFYDFDRAATLINLLNWGAVGCTYIHTNSLEDKDALTSEFWKEYSELSKLELVENKEAHPYEMSQALESVCILRKKKDSKALTKKKVKELISKHKRTEDNV